MLATQNDGPEWPADDVQMLPQSVATGVKGGKLGWMSITGCSATFVVVSGIALVMVVLAAARFVAPTVIDPVAPVKTFPTIRDMPCPPATLPTPTYAAHAPFVLRNANLWVGDGARMPIADILVENGRISRVGVALQTAGDVQVIDVAGAIVTPGIVDVHSHAGVNNFPVDLRGSDDTNEATAPITNFVRAMDAFDPEDPALRHIRNGGITTSQILPGSANVMGGESFVVKMRGGTVEEARLVGARRALKMACGENPKRVYGNRGQMPSTRMGSAWLMRQRFDEARTLMQEQDEWCANPPPNTRKPYDIGLDSLVALLRGEALLHCHCYQIHDMEMMIRNSHEFGFNISAFHHSLEGWKLANVLAANNIGVATFSNLWGAKVEQLGESVYASSVLTDAGVTTVLKSDHPVLDASTLIYELGKAVSYGLDESKAIQLLTSAGAQLLGLQSRVGRVAAGLDADLVVWDRNPLLLGARPQRLFIEGISYIQANLPAGLTVLPSRTAELTVPATSTACGAASSAGYVIRGVTVHTMQDSEITPISNADIAVVNGVVTCIASSCPLPGADVYTLSGGHVIPGMISGAAALGLIEIELESVTHDGTVPLDFNGGVHDSIDAADGVRIRDSLLVQSALNAGITTAVVGPTGGATIRGTGVAYATSGKTIDDALFATGHGHNIGVYASVGSDFRGSTLTASTSGQLSILRQKMRALTEIEGQVPLIVRVDQADDIAGVLRVQRECASSANKVIPLIIVGGAEAHIVVDLLVASPSVAVVYIPTPPATWSTRRANESTLSILRGAGVKCGLAVENLELLRDLRWQAGLAADRNGFSTHDGIGLVTSNLADIFGIPSRGRIQVGQTANFVALNGEPLSFQAGVQLIAQGGTVMCKPRQL